MTETEWLSCVDPAPMLKALWGMASDRKLRLFAAACCRGVLPLLEDKRSHQAVTLAERLADGLPCRESELAAVRNAAEESQDRALSTHSHGAWPDDPGWYPDQTFNVEESQVERLAKSAKAAAMAALAVAQPIGLGTAAEIVRLIGEISAEEKESRCVETTPAAFLRDLFGPLPFRLVTLDPTWLAWNDGMAEKLARGINEERAFHRLPILADALEEAGCDEESVLVHCRGSGPHIRGCWVVDLLLGQS
jgi:hypothetical protein